MGLAILDVAQAAHKNWKASRSSKTNHKKATWRDIFDVTVKWRRLGQTAHKLAKLQKEFFLENEIENALVVERS